MGLEDGCVAIVAGIDGQRDAGWICGDAMASGFAGSDSEWRGRRRFSGSTFGVARTRAGDGALLGGILGARGWHRDAYGIVAG